MRDPQFLRFILTGGIAAVANIASRVVLSRYLDFQVSIVIAYIIGMTTAFILAKRYVFQPSGRQTYKEYLRFTLVNCVALIQVWLVSIILAYILIPRIGLSTGELIAHMLAVASPVITSYFAHKFFTFQRDKTTSP